MSEQNATESEFLITFLLKNLFSVLRHVAKDGLKEFYTKDTFILSCTCEPFSGISSGYYPPIEKNEYSDAFEKERSGEEVRTGGGWRMNARGGGHASPPPLSSPPHPASEGLEAHYSTQLGNLRFWGHPNFSGCGTLSLGGPHLFTHFR